MGKLETIPQPPGWPILGNVFDIDMEYPLFSLYDLAKQYGEIYRMKFPGHTFIIANSYAMVNEFCDERRFPKTIFALKEMRHAMHDGLFTSIGEVEPNWGIAHRILTPAFGPPSLRRMYDGMYDIASQLVMKWARHGKSAPINVTEDLTRLTLDTIALCSMDFRFNSYYKEGTHPFVTAMSTFLTESGDRARRLPIPSFFYKKADNKFFGDIDVMRSTAREILQERKRMAPEELALRNDLLSAMLNGVDSQTGQKMTEESILDNLITFLIAGHETTAGMLSFAMYHMINDPEIYAKAREEVDRVCGKTPIKFDHLNKLPYLSAILRETLRLTPPLPVINVAPARDEIVGGKYVIKEGELIIVLVGHSHLDPKVYGEDVNEFHPERMNDENFQRLNEEFPNAWKPFGNGARACIGRPFAWQEALLVLAILFQNFDFQLDDQDYKLKIKQTLTVKPDNFKIKATPRDLMTATQLEHKLAGTTALNSQSSKQAIPGSDQELKSGKPMNIYYGSNSGTCQSMADLLAADAYAHGFYAAAVESLDKITGDIPTDRPVVFITASYEGKPPDNAKGFVTWLEDLKAGTNLQGVNYAVFGCGNKDWAATFHRVPRLVDTMAAKHGATRLVPLGLTDVSRGNEMTDFETWEDEHLWPALMSKYDTVRVHGTALDVEITHPRRDTLHQDVNEGIVTSSRTLSSASASSRKEHVEIQLPKGMTYRAGDYLTVLPVNPSDTVQRVMRHFGLPLDAHLKISGNSQTFLPEDVSVPATHIFGSYVELAQPATKRNILALSDKAQDPATKEKLHLLANDDLLFVAEIIGKRLSLLDLLETHPDIQLPMSTFLQNLPPMKARQYSIGSSPLSNPTSVALTYSVLDVPCLADVKRRHLGSASNYLASSQAGDTLHVSVRPSHAAFHLPLDTKKKTPVIMIAAGSGIAPFRGFIQERAHQSRKGESVAEAVLYFGCRAPLEDDLYKSELDNWESQKVVTVKRSYSRQTEASQGCRYVQDRLWADRDHVLELWEQGAMIYICGSRGVASGVKEKLVNIFVYAAETRGKEVEKEAIRVWFDALKNERYAVDVFE